MCPIFQADASVMFAEISLAKASGMATPSVRVGGHKELPGEAWVQGRLKDCRPFFMLTQI